MAWAHYGNNNRIMFMKDRDGLFFDELNLKYL